MMAYDDFYEYFRSPMQEMRNDSYYYGGMSGYPNNGYQQPQQNPFGVESRRYQYGDPQVTPYTQAPSAVNPAPYAAESRRDDRVGMLNPSPFAGQNTYSAPIAHQQPQAYQPRPQVPQYSDSNPVNGFNSIYTRPPVPAAPPINWETMTNRPMAPEVQNPYYSGYQAPHLRLKDEDWVSIVNKNFAQNL